MAVILPTLTEDGFLDNPQLMLTKLYEYFLSSDYSQSVSFFGNISSLRYIVRKYNEDIDILKMEISDALNVMIGRYWSDYEVTVNIVNYNPDRLSFVIKTEIVVTVNGERYSLTEDTSVEKSTLVKIESYMNYLESGEYK